MDEGAPIEIANDEPLWNQAIQDVNAWRGACLQHFSAAEAAVTETLLLLKAIPGRGEAVRLRHLIGQRFDDLSKLIEAEGAFAQEGKAAAKRSEEHTSELQSLMRISYAVFCLKTTNTNY